MQKLQRRITDLEARRPAQPAAGGWSLADWRADYEAHRGESVAAWLARVTSDAWLSHWPAERRAVMLAQYHRTAELMTMMQEGVL